MRPRKKPPMSYLPVYLSVFVLVVVVVALRVMQYQGGQDAPAESNAQSFCGYVVGADLKLDHDIDCSAKELGVLPRVENLSFALLVQASDVSIDCQGHTIKSEGGIGVLVEQAKNVHIKNCRFEKIDFAIRAEKAEGLDVTNVWASVVKGGIQALHSKAIRIQKGELIAADPLADYGVEIVDGDSILLESLLIEGFRHSGVNLYGAANFSVKECTINNIEDTGIGFFDQPETGPTENGTIEKSTFTDIRNVGAFEVMQSSRNIRFVDNSILRSRAALAVYENGKWGSPTNLRFAKNTVEQCLWPASIRDAKNVQLESNVFTRNSGGTLIEISNSENVSITRNRFELNNGAVALTDNVADVRFEENRYSSHIGPFLRIENDCGDCRFGRNNWGQCPKAELFDGIEYPDGINPVIIESESETAEWPMVDENRDGIEDSDCGKKTPTAIQ